MTTAQQQTEASEVKAFAGFLKWEQSSRDTIDFKKIYIDMAGDLCAGLMLSQIVYYYLPGKDGRSKLRVSRDGHLWIAKRRDEWWDEIRLKPDAADTAIEKLRKKNLIVTALFKFAGAPTVHLRLNEDEFLKSHASILANPQNPNRRTAKMQIGEKPKTLTQTTAETTKQDNTCKAPEALALTAETKAFDANASAHDTFSIQPDPVKTANSSFPPSTEKTVSTVDVAAKTPSPKVAQKGSPAPGEGKPRNPVFEAIARGIFDAKDSAGVSAVGGRVAPILHGTKRGQGCMGLLDYEKARQGADAIDLDALAAAVPSFIDWYKAKYNASLPQDCAKFIGHWQAGRGTVKAVEERPQPDPNCFDCAGSGICVDFDTRAPSPCHCLKPAKKPTRHPTSCKCRGQHFISFTDERGNMLARPCDGVNEPTHEVAING